MANLNFLFQALTPSNHAEAVKQILSLNKPKEIIFSVAFVREEGLMELEKNIKPLSKITKIYFGIRNEITSVQAINRLLDIGVQLFAVDTASRTQIFHPKVYLAYSDLNAKIIIGSANLTFGGIYNNIEVSTLIDLNLNQSSDKKFLHEATDIFSNLNKKFPNHIFEIKNRKQTKELLNQGRLVDEKTKIIPRKTNSGGKGERDQLSPMKLHSKPRPKIRPTSQTSKKKKPASPQKTDTLNSEYNLVWESGELTRRDINIPKSTKTHSTGSMGLKKGKLEGVDHRHYFREEVFANLNWRIEKEGSKWERARANFELIIKNVNYGIFNLMLSHNTDKSSATYKQKNFMTHINWGPILKYVAKHDLLGRYLFLYASQSDPEHFLIEID
ncbi:phospholipase D family protein [Nitrospina gracilis]|uniref:phospholipase D family protein n=1 Tax=Nitrospina gracilis TaxID=35801 RepID=UPI001F2B9FE0|nr:phospholipase D family protein [Nitrospina gracilis]MCF8721605.1 HKD family nuclease [Nitrospina gracilis Nb-211]